MKSTPLTMVALMILGLVAGCTSQGHGKAVAASSSAAPAPVPALSKTRATVIQNSLTNPDTAKVAAVLAPDVRSAYMAAPSALWPAGCSVTVDYTKFKASGANLATVPATVSGTQPGRFVLLLSYVQGQWVVEATHKVT
jgi:hypothetical protein